MKHLSLLTLVSLASCASMKESLQLGAGMGAISGAAATYSAHQSMGRSAKLEDVAVGAVEVPPVLAVVRLVRYKS